MIASDLHRPLWLFVAVLPVLIWSGVSPHDHATWLLEIAPILIGFPLIAVSARRFPLSTLLLVLIALHSYVLIVGGHYTYARVPLGEWAQGWFGWQRNNYDKLGHFAQGFMPAILAREILLRRSPLPRGKWLIFVIVSICLAFSACFEMIEWFVALALGGADAFLGTQGYVWDTQSDMAWAVIGAASALALLSRAHDRSMKHALGAVAP
jgi:putative membrane protein